MRAQSLLFFIAMVVCLICGWLAGRASVPPSLEAPMLTARDPDLARQLRPAIEDLIANPDTRLAFVERAVQDIGEDRLKVVVYLLLLDLKPELKNSPATLRLVRRGIGLKSASAGGGP